MYSVTNKSFYNILENLTSDHKLVYDIIDDSGQHGISKENLLLESKKYFSNPDIVLNVKIMNIVHDLLDADLISIRDDYLILLNENFFANDNANGKINQIKFKSFLDKTNLHPADKIGLLFLFSQIIQYRQNENEEKTTETDNNNILNLRKLENYLSNRDNDMNTEVLDNQLILLSNLGVISFGNNDHQIDNPDARPHNQEADGNEEGKGTGTGDYDPMMMKMEYDDHRGMDSKPNLDDPNDNIDHINDDDFIDDEDENIFDSSSTLSLSSPFQPLMISPLLKFR